MLPGSLELGSKKGSSGPLRVSPPTHRGRRHLRPDLLAQGARPRTHPCWPKLWPSRTVASAIRPCDHVAGVVLMDSPRNARRRPYDFGLKVVGALRAIIATSPKAAAFETCVPSRMGTDHYGRAFRSARHRRAQRGRHAGRVFPMGMTCAVCWKLQKQGSSSRSRFFLDMARTPILRGGGVANPSRKSQPRIFDRRPVRHASFAPPGDPERSHRPPRLLHKGKTATWKGRSRSRQMASRRVS